MNRYLLIAPLSAFLMLIGCGPNYEGPSYGYHSRNGSYYADEHYRDGRHYRDRRMTQRDRVYRGRDGRYYCLRRDGTTGLIIGGAIGALIGYELDRGSSSLIGALIGAGTGALLGREIEQGRLRCN